MSIAVREPVRATATDPNWLLATILDHSPYVVMLAGPDRRVTYANGHFCGLSGYGVADFGAALPEPLDFGAMEPPERAAAKVALAAGETVRFRYPIRSRRGHTCHLELTALPRLSSTDAPEGWLIMGHEVTTEIRLHEQATSQAHRLQLTLESARMGTWEVNNETGEIIVDDGWLQLAGISQSDRDLAAQLWQSRIHPDDQPIILKRMNNAIQGTADVQTSQYRIVQPDGRVLWIQDTSRITERTADGGPLRLVGVVVDITDLKDSAQRAQRSAERLSVATEAADMGVWDHDLLAGTYYWSERMRAIHGLTTEPDSIKLYASMTHPDDQARVAADVQVARATGKPVNIRYRIVRPDGTIRWVEVFGQVQKGPDGKVTRAVGITRDITVQAQMEMERQQAMKLESVGRLAAGVAHEINTPLQYVSENLRFIDNNLWALTDLLKDLQEAQDVEALGRVRDRARADADAAYGIAEIPEAITEALHGIDRISTIVRAMNTFNHPANERTAVDINKVIANALTVARSEWRRVATVETDFDTTLPTVPLLPGEFNQVILNLVVNAAHAIAERQEGEPSHQGVIRIRTRQAGGMVEVGVADNGRGMSPDVQAKVFDPFFTTKPIGKGTGQGLALAHRFMEAHQGTISVQSVPGQGSEFVLRLPLSP
jgi:two-component system NtrC family sensor kinase